MANFESIKISNCNEFHGLPEVCKDENWSDVRFKVEDRISKQTEAVWQ